HLSAKVRVFVNWVAELFAHHPQFGETQAGQPQPSRHPKLAA
ncbi:MAG: LysR family transcriptional regulator, partial [Gammaproteobacteria bacterium]